MWCVSNEGEIEGERKRSVSLRGIEGERGKRSWGRRSGGERERCRKEFEGGRGKRRTNRRRRRRTG